MKGYNDLDLEKIMDLHLCVRLCVHVCVCVCVFYSTFIPGAQAESKTYISV